MNDRESIDFMKRVLKVEKDIDMLKVHIATLKEEIMMDMLKRGIKPEEA